jgi:hypothetical protein
MMFFEADKGKTMHETDNYLNGLNFATSPFLAAILSVYD